jgi:hypothetical protein
MGDRELPERSGDSTPDLTVIVPTIPGRESLLSRCLYTLQAPGTAEILVVDGPGPLGDKVNLAANVARGRYLTVVDDDDYVTADYYRSILPALTVDFVGFNVVELHAGIYQKTTAIRGDLNRWGSTQRGPTPKGVTRRELWQRFGNDYKSDRDWLRTVAPLIETHTYIDRDLYVYDHYGNDFRFENGSRDVGFWPFDETQVRRISLSPP